MSLSSDPSQPQNGQNTELEHQEEKPEASEKKQPAEPINEQFIESNIELAQQLKSEGNQLFKNQQFLPAINKYQQALRYASPQENKFRSVLYSNISICLSKELNYKDSLPYCQKSVACDPTYTKAQLNLAILYEKVDNLEAALEQNKKLLQLLPNDKKVLLKVQDLQKAIQTKNEQQKKEVMDGLKNIGNSILGYFGMSLDNFKMEQGENGGYSVSMRK